jgi:hypothetical protein
MSQKEYDRQRYIKQREKILAQTTKYQKEHREQTNINHRHWHHANKDNVINSRLKSRFGITLEQYNEMFKKQNGVCAICKMPEKHIDKRFNRPRNLAVDHCHNSKKVRGLLCFDCNSGIGKLKDSYELIMIAANYIKEGDNI